MNRKFPWLTSALLAIIVAGVGAGTTANADAVTAVQVLREGGCGGRSPAAAALHRSAVLDRAAEQVAAGRSADVAVERTGYRAQATATVHVRGPDAGLIAAIERAGCGTVTNRDLQDIGVYRSGQDTWILLAAAYVIPSRAQAPALATRVLSLVNEVRARGVRCGARYFGPAPPLVLSGTLATVAEGHAVDMAAHDYFEHEDLAGRTPADRIRAAGYAEKLVGENIAYGPKTADDVVQGWLDSPGHCENIMDPRFVQMGVAFAPGRGAKRGLYWVQDLVEPKT
jgi:uncharacterized protein YkwD